MNARSIRFRLVVWYAGLLIVVFVLLSVLIYGGLKIYLEASLSKAQVRRAQQISDTLLANIQKTGENFVVNEINSWFAPETNDRFIRITRADGTVLYLSQNPRDLSFDPHGVPAFHGKANGTSWRKEADVSNQKLLIAVVACQTPDGHRFLTEVGASFEPVQAVLNRLMVLLLLTFATLLAVATGGGYFLVGRALAPVDKIAGSAEQITLHNLKDRLPVPQTGDELERLSVALNHMISRLEDALQHNRRFIADASHELRTPLTIMRGELESIVDETGKSPEVQRTAASALEEVERLARIVEGLFGVSRLDAGEAQKEWVQFDLAALATSTAEQMCLLAEDKSITISTHTPHMVLIEGDRARLKQVVVNLLDNAIKYTPEGGKIHLNVVACDNKAILEVEDNGIGIPAAEQQHIFERFFRVDKARSRDIGGAGLGLAIVKSICAAHGGKVDFQSTEGAGSRFKVELPLSTNHLKPEYKNGN